jgi:hypothetical protein
MHTVEQLESVTAELEHDAALDSLSRALSVRPARRRSTRLGRKLAGQRFDLRDLCGGETTGAGQGSPSHAIQAVLLRTIVAATMHTSLSHIRSASDLSSSMAQLPLLALAQRDHILAATTNRIPKRYGKSFNQPGNIFPT